MKFWNERSVEPKRKFRWLLYFSGMPQFIVKSVKKPSFAVATTPHDFLKEEVDREIINKTICDIEKLGPKHHRKLIH